MNYLLIALVVVLTFVCGMLYSSNKTLAASQTNQEYATVSAGKAISTSFKLSH